MKYNIEFDLPARETIKGVHFKLHESVYREFKYATEQQRRSMTEVISKLMKEFCAEFRRKGAPKQVGLPYED